MISRRACDPLRWGDAFRGILKCARHRHSLAGPVAGPVARSFPREMSAGLTCNRLVAYIAADGCRLQSFGGREPSKVARPITPAQRTDAWRIVRTPRHDAPGRLQ